MKKNYIGCWMSDKTKTEYKEALTKLSNNINTIVDEVYTDLDKCSSIMSYVESEKRNKLIKCLDGFAAVCKMVSKTNANMDNSKKILTLSASSTKPQSKESTAKIDSAVRAIRSKGSSGKNALERAVSRGLDAVSSEKDKMWLAQEVLQNRDIIFFTDVLQKMYYDEKSSTYKGKNGYAICSDEYIKDIQKRAFVKDAVVTWGNHDYKAKIQAELYSILTTFKTDLEKGKKDNDYIKDENAGRMKTAIKNLESVGISLYNLESKVDELCWYVGGDESDIKNLQKMLTSLGIRGKSGTLKEDGVYGKETLYAWNKFGDILVRGSVPTIGYINPLQSNITGLTHQIRTVNKPRGSIRNIYPMEKLPDTYRSSIILKNSGGNTTRAFMLDKPHYENGKAIGYHMNIEVEVPKPLQQFFYNTKEIDEKTYLKLKDFQQASKRVRAAGKVLVVAGVALDALELGKTIHSDLNDADRKLGKETVSTVVSIGSSWAFGALGAKTGAMAGAALGTAVFPVVGTAVGATVFGLIGGVAGAYGGEKVSEWIVDVTLLE